MHKAAGFYLRLCACHQMLQIIARMAVLAWMPRALRLLRSSSRTALVLFSCAHDDDLRLFRIAVALLIEAIDDKAVIQA